MKLAIVGPLPPPYGGMANQTNQLKRLLEQEGVEVSLVQTNAPYANKFIENLPGIRAGFRLVPYLSRLWQIAGKVDCIHVMANSGWSWQLFAAPAIWLGRLRACPVVVNYRGGEAQQYLDKSLFWVAPTLKKASRLTVPSGFLQQVFSGFNFDSIVIPNIVDTDKFKLRLLAKIKDPLAPKIVVTRNLEAIYGLKIAIEAIEIAAKSIPNIHMYVAGSGPQLEELTQLIEQKQLQNNITLTGKLPPDEITELYARSDIMLNPTTVDNMPNSVLEALAVGLPVITTNVGGIPYIVSDGQTALFTEINNPQMMAEKLIQLVKDPDLYSRLVNNGRLAIESYTWEKVKHQWLGLYRQVVAEAV